MQARRAVRFAIDNLAIGVGASFGASRNKGTGDHLSLESRLCCLNQRCER